VWDNSVNTHAGSRLPCAKTEEDDKICGEKSDTKLTVICKLETMRRFAASDVGNNEVTP
jgi:hypothetical protein